MAEFLDPNVSTTDPPDEDLGRLLFKLRKARGEYKTPADELEADAQARGLTVTSKNTGTHVPNSAHYDNRAVDIRTKDQPQSLIDQYIAEKKAQGYKVLDERVNPASSVSRGPHVHLQAPRGGVPAQGDQSQPGDQLGDILSAVRQKRQSSQASQQRDNSLQNFMNQGGVGLADTSVNTLAGGGGNRQTLYDQPAGPVVSKPLPPPTRIQQQQAEKVLNTPWQENYYKNNPLTKQELQTVRQQQAQDWANSTPGSYIGTNVAVPAVKAATGILAPAVSNVLKYGARGAQLLQTGGYEKDTPVDTVANAIKSGGKNIVQGLDNSGKVLERADPVSRTLQMAGEGAGTLGAFAGAGLLGGPVAEYGLLAASQDWDDPKKAAINTLLNAAMMVTGGKLAKPSQMLGEEVMLATGKPALGTAANVLARTLANAGIGGAGSVATQALTNEPGQDINYREALKQAAMGGAFANLAPTRVGYNDVVGPKGERMATPEVSPENPQTPNAVINFADAQRGDVFTHGKITKNQPAYVVENDGKWVTLEMPDGKTKRILANSQVANSGELVRENPGQASQAAAPAGTKPVTTVKAADGTIIENGPNSRISGMPPRGRQQEVIFVPPAPKGPAGARNVIENTLRETGVKPPDQPVSTPAESVPVRASETEAQTTPAEAPVEAATPKGRIVNVSGKDFTLTPEQEARWQKEVDEPLNRDKKAIEYAERALAQAKDDKSRSFWSDQIQKAKRDLHGTGMEVAAAKRDIVGARTAKEQAAYDKRQASNYLGKEVTVTVNGEQYDGVVHGTSSFGKVPVKLSDGQIVHLNPDQITARVARPTPAEAPVEAVKVNAPNKTEGLPVGEFFSEGGYAPDADGTVHGSPEQLARVAELRKQGVSQADAWERVFNQRQAAGDKMRSELQNGDILEDMHGDRHRVEWTTNRRTGEKTLGLYSKNEENGLESWEAIDPKDNHRLAEMKVVERGGSAEKNTEQAQAQQTPAQKKSEKLAQSKEITFGDQSPDRPLADRQADVKKALGRIHAQKIDKAARDAQAKALAEQHGLEYQEGTLSKSNRAKGTPAVRIINPQTGEVLHGSEKYFVPNESRIEQPRTVGEAPEAQAETGAAEGAKAGPSEEAPAGLAKPGKPIQDIRAAGGFKKSEQAVLVKMVRPDGHEFWQWEDSKENPLGGIFVDRSMAIANRPEGKSIFTDASGEPLKEIHPDTRQTEGKKLPDLIEAKTVGDQAHVSFNRGDIPVLPSDIENALKAQGHQAQVTEIKPFGRAAKEQKFRIDFFEDGGKTAKPPSDWYKALGLDSEQEAVLDKTAGVPAKEVKQVKAAEDKGPHGMIAHEMRMGAPDGAGGAIGRPILHDDNVRKALGLDIDSNIDDASPADKKAYSSETHQALTEAMGVTSATHISPEMHIQWAKDNLHTLGEDTASEYVRTVVRGMIKQALKDQNIKYSVAQEQIQGIENHLRRVDAQRRRDQRITDGDKLRTELEDLAESIGLPASAGTRAAEIYLAGSEGPGGGTSQPVYGRAARESADTGSSTEASKSGDRPEETRSVRQAREENVAAVNKQFEKVLKRKGVIEESPGVYHFPNKMLSDAQAKSLIKAASASGSLGERRFEIKDRGLITGYAGDKGWVIIDRNITNPEYHPEPLNVATQETATKQPWEMTRDEYRAQKTIWNHQTWKEFDNFDLKEADRLYPRYRGIDRIGVWFTDKSDFYGPTNVEAHLTINNPKVFPQGEGGAKEVWATLKKEVKEAGSPELYRQKLLKEGYDAISLPDSSIDLEKSDSRQHIMIALDPSSPKIISRSVKTPKSYGEEAPPKEFDAHKEAVNKALSEGKPVPPEVLADYPDLQKSSKNYNSVKSPQAREENVAEPEEAASPKMRTAEEAGRKGKLLDEIDRTREEYEKAKRVAWLASNNMEKGEDGRWTRVGDTAEQVALQEAKSNYLAAKKAYEKAFPGPREAQPVDTNITSEVDKLLGEFKRTSPEPGTPEREALDKESSGGWDKVDALNKQLTKAKSAKAPKAEILALQKQLKEAKAARDKAISPSLTRSLEDAAANTSDPLVSAAARYQLAIREGERPSSDVLDSVHDLIAKPIATALTNNGLERGVAKERARELTNTLLTVPTDTRYNNWQKAIKEITKDELSRQADITGESPGSKPAKGIKGFLSDERGALNADLSELPPQEQLTKEARGVNKARKGEEGVAPIIQDAAQKVVDLVNKVRGIRSPGKVSQNIGKMPSKADFDEYINTLYDAVDKATKDGRVEVDPKNPAQLSAKAAAKLKDNVQALATAWKNNDRAGFTEAQRQMHEFIWNPKYKVLHDLFRPIMLSGEYSFAMIQGGIAAMTHPFVWSKSMAKATAAGFDPMAMTGIKGPKAFKEFWWSHGTNNFDKFIFDISHHRLAKEAAQDKLQLDSLADIDLKKSYSTAEGYAASFIQKLPLIKQTEIAMKVFLDSLRLQYYEQAHDMLTAKGFTRDANPELFKDAARTANIFSGRGDFGPIESSVPLINNLGLAPRFVLAQFQQILSGPKVLGENLTRGVGNTYKTLRGKQADITEKAFSNPVDMKIMRDYAKILGVSAGAAALATAAGWEIPLDPDDPKFLMAKPPGSINGYSIVPSGWQPQLKFMGRLIKRIVDNQALGGPNTMAGTLSEMGGDVAHYARSKAGIIPSLAIDTGTQYRENKYSPPVSPDEDLTKLRDKNLVEEGLKKGMNYFSPGSFDKMDKAITQFGGYGTNYVNKPVNLLDSITNRLAPVYANQLLDDYLNPAMTSKEEATRAGLEFFGYRTQGIKGNYSDTGRIDRSLHKEFNRQGVQLYGVRQDPNESDQAYGDRVKRINDLYNEYGPKLLDDPTYKEADKQTKVKMLESFRKRVSDFNEGLANKQDPNLDKLEADSIMKSIETNQKHQRSVQRRRLRDNYTFTPTIPEDDL